MRDGNRGILFGILNLSFFGGQIIAFTPAIILTIVFHSKGIWTSLIVIGSISVTVAIPLAFFIRNSLIFLYRSNLSREQGDDFGDESIGYGCSLVHENFDGREIMHKFLICILRIVLILILGSPTITSLVLYIGTSKEKDLILQFFLGNFIGFAVISMIVMGLFYEVNPLIMSGPLLGLPIIITMLLKK